MPFKKTIYFFMVYCAALVVSYLILMRCESYLFGLSIFFVSTILSAMIPAGMFYFFKKYSFIKSSFENFLVAVIGFFVLFTFSVFGPVFIDRSISYHLVFYAVENGAIQENVFQKQFADSVFQKRILDAQMAKFLEKTPEGTYVPTKKAFIFSGIMKLIGKLSGTMDNYDKTKV